VFSGKSKADKIGRKNVERAVHEMKPKPLKKPKTLRMHRGRKSK
jgi:hypothetical protein